MKPATISKPVFLLGLCLLGYGVTSAADGDTRARRMISAPAGTPVRTNININAISTVIKNTGILDIDRIEQNSGLVYPKGTGKTAVFQSGFLWGAKILGAIRVGGSAYREGMQPGKILSPGIAEDPDLPKNRIYRMRRDEEPDVRIIQGWDGVWDSAVAGSNADLFSEMFDEGAPEDTIRAQYETDWTEWPVGDGAPYVDLDSNGSYDPQIDIPGIPGADQTTWYVANDLSVARTMNLYGSQPMGIEMQVTMWAYDRPGSLGRVFFRRYLLINKSFDLFEDMYISAWSDPDVGNSTDDFVGCDTTLDLGYCYNAADTDALYSPLPPPAVGFVLLRGPLVESPGDTGVFNGYPVPDHANLGMTAFYYFTRGDSVVRDPIQGMYTGSLEFYNFFHGRVGVTGELFTDPNTDEMTPFALAGDPVTGLGWVDGQRDSAADRRLGLCSGPIAMAAVDTQEIIIAEILGGATPGVDRLSAVTQVKSSTGGIREFFDSAFVVTAVPGENPEIPAQFSLSQNYPNPFNPVTTVTYSLPVRSMVQVRVFDILGRQAALLVDELKGAGTHVVRWDASSYPSGVYYCTLSAGAFAQTKKLLLIR